MSSSQPELFQILPASNPHHDYEACLSASLSSSQIGTDYILYDNDRSYRETIEILQERGRHCMNSQYFAAQPDITVGAYPPTPLPLACDVRQDSLISGYGPDGYDWQMYQSMGVPVTTAAHRPLKRARTTHQRTPSASTVASTGPASPYTANALHPQIANTDYSPHSPAQAAYADQALFPKNLPTPSHTPTVDSFYNYYIPSQVAHTPNAHLAMKGFAIDHHSADDYAPEIYQSSRQSMSSHGNNSPATPRSGVGDVYDAKNFAPQNDFRQPSNLQLFRSESQAYQDELYNPPTNYTSTPVSAPKRHTDLLTPHRNLINERLQTANLARGGSPASAISRERSPFRDGSPLAPTGADWNNAQAIGMASNMRQQQREEAAQAEYARSMPGLPREPTKTISPKDAVLDYTETDHQQPLFHDNIPAGYRQHTGGNDTWQNGFVNQPGASYGNLVAASPNPQMANLPASADASHEANFGGFMQLPPTQHDATPQVQNNSYQNSSYAVPKMHYVDSNPEFPAQLTSMESSISEGGPPASSQESFNNSSMPQRPADTRANTGTYTCTYHGCTQRFDSHNNLQRHKRDFHRSQHKDTTSDENAGSSTSARSTESPAPSNAGMTSAAIQARNSQAGPHKCTRINPSTNKPCNTIFSRPYDLTRHEDTIHNNRKHKVRCPMCREEKTFSRNDALTRHMRVVHPEVETYGKRGRRDD